MMIRYIISLLSALAAAGLCGYALHAALQISYVTLADGRRQERRLSILLRMLLPFTAPLLPFSLHRRFGNVRDRIRKRLVTAGYETLLRPEEMIALRVLMPLVFGTLLNLLLLTAALNLSGGPGAALRAMRVPLALFICAVFAGYPDLWLNRKVRARHQQIVRALPFVLDLLTLSVEAGMDFLAALQRITARRGMDPLGEELLRVFREIQVGKTRREALRDMSERVNHSDVRSVTHALVQADELGTGIAAALRIQAEQMRARRFQRAEKLANEAPVKMLFPLVAFIFPTVFIILLGPLFVQLLH
jgi:tight adherence protein C